jgi:hypothetical protein
MKYQRIRSRNPPLISVATVCADHVTPLYPQKLSPTSPKSGGCSVSIVRLRTKGHGVRFVLEMLFVFDRKHMDGPSWPPTEIALLCYTWMIFAPHMKHDRPSRPLTGLALYFYMWMMFMPHWKNTYIHHGPLRGFLYFFICR